MNKVMNGNELLDRHPDIDVKKRRLNEELKSDTTKHWSEYNSGEKFAQLNQHVTAINVEVINIGYDERPDNDYNFFHNIHSTILTPPFQDGFGYCGREAIALKDGITCYNEQLRWIHEFMEKHIHMVHSPIYEKWDHVFSSGNTHSINLIIETLLNDGDFILVEEFTYPDFKMIVENSMKDISLIGVAMDKEGVVPSELESILKLFSRTNNIEKLKMLYINPTGQNPTGVTLTTERKRQIYELAKTYKFLILEDDPYYYFQMNEYYTIDKRSLFPIIPNEDEFVKSLQKSFLSIDTDGRVLRLDSFSKSICPGLKMGMIIGERSIVQQLNEKLCQRDIKPCKLSAMMMYHLLLNWGSKGYINWLLGLNIEFANKRDLIMDSIYQFFQTHLDSNLIKLSIPTGGMFFIIYVNITKHDKYNMLSNEADTCLELEQKIQDFKHELEQKIYQSCISNNVVILPGSYFEVTTNKYNTRGKTFHDYIFFRGTFVSCSFDDLFVGIERIYQVLQKEFNL